MGVVWCPAAADGPMPGAQAHSTAVGCGRVVDRGLYLRGVVLPVVRHREVWRCRRIETTTRPGPGRWRGGRVHRETGADDQRAHHTGDQHRPPNAPAPRADDLSE